jgi:hypothetical protein
MDAYMVKAALEMAMEDSAFAAALDKADKLTVSESEDGTVTLEAGDESVEISAEELLEGAQEERDEEAETGKVSTLPPPPAAKPSGIYGAVMSPGAVK